MKKLFNLVILTLFGSLCYSQVIFVTENRYEADYKIFITDRRYEANWWIFQTDRVYDAKNNRGQWFVTNNRYEADYVIFITEINTM